MHITIGNKIFKSIIVSLLNKLLLQPRGSKIIIIFEIENWTKIENYLSLNSLHLI
jgi:hypothetical protein